MLRVPVFLDGSDFRRGWHCLCRYPCETEMESRNLIAAVSPSFHGGVGAVDRASDGLADLLVGTGRSDPSRVRVLDGLTLAELDSFFAFDNYDGAFVAGA